MNLTPKLTYLSRRAAQRQLNHHPLQSSNKSNIAIVWNNYLKRIWMIQEKILLKQMCYQLTIQITQQTRHWMDR